MSWSDLRTGIGVDVHPLVPGRPMAVAAITWPDEVGPAGHSDGDVVAHAVCDALLSAASLGDLGSQVGTDRPEWAGASGPDLLAAVLDLVEGEGWRVINVAVQLIGERPRVGDRREEAQAALSAALRGAPVSLGATTTDGLGALGRVEGLAAVATALLAR